MVPYSYLCQEQGWNWSLMLSTDKKYMQCYHSNTNNLTPLDGITLIYPKQAPKSIKVQKPIYVLCLQQVCNATSQHFHLPPHYENHQMMINISLNIANLNTIGISSQSSEYGNIWRTTATRPSSINWLRYLQFLLFIYTSS